MVLVNNPGSSSAIYAPLPYDPWRERTHLFVLFSGGITMQRDRSWVRRRTAIDDLVRPFPHAVAWGSLFDSC